MRKQMHLCPTCAEKLKDIRSVVLHRVTARKERCEECGKKKPCDEYQVSRKGETSEKVRPASL